MQSGSLLDEVAPESLEAQLRESLAQIHKEAGIPGIAISVSVRGRHFGAEVGTLAIDSPLPMHRGARFQVGCITKLLVAIAAAEMIERGVLDPDALVSTYLPELADLAATRDLCIWHLLSHTSGYQGMNLQDPSVAYYFNWEKFVAYLRTTPILFQPGRVFSYEHSEYVILGEILERIAGDTISALVTRLVLAPMGLEAGAARADTVRPDFCVVDHALDRGSYRKLKAIPFGAFWRAALSDLTLSLDGLLQLAEAIAGIVSIPGLSPGALQLVQKQVLRLPRTVGSARPEQIPAAFGLGCAAYRGWLLGHNGSARGQACGLRFDPRNGIAVAIGMNAWQPYLRDLLFNSVIGVLRRQAVPPWPETPLGIPLQELVGTYVGARGTSIEVLQRSEGTLRCLVNTAGQGQPLVIDLSVVDQRGLEVVSDAQHHSVGFFRDQETGALGAMFGLMALRKQASQAVA